MKQSMFIALAVAVWLIATCIVFDAGSDMMIERYFPAQSYYTTTTK